MLVSMDNRPLADVCRHTETEQAQVRKLGNPGRRDRREQNDDIGLRFEVVHIAEVGVAKAQETLRTALAMGADRAILIEAMDSLLSPERRAQLIPLYEADHPVERGRIAQRELGIPLPSKPLWIATLLTLERKNSCK